MAEVFRRRRRRRRRRDPLTDFAKTVIGLFAVGVVTARRYQDTREARRDYATARSAEFTVLESRALPAPEEEE